MNADQLKRKAANLSPAEQDQLIQNLMADVDDRARLETLSDFELIRETLKSDAADDNRVLELMARIYPRWFDEPEAPEMPERPRSICIALQIDVAHEVVAFSECHCGELITGTGNTTKEDEAAQPCLWCACRAALYRATKEEMYRPEA